MSDDDYELDECDSFDISQQMSSVDTGLSIMNSETGIEKKLYAYIGPEDIRNPNGKLKVFIPNFNNAIPEEIASDALNDIVFSYKYNPFLLDFNKFKKIDEENIRNDFKEKLCIPFNVSELFFDYKQKIGKPKDVSNELSKTKLPELFGSQDHLMRFGTLDLTCEEDINFVLKHKIPYLLIKLYLKYNRIQFRLMVDVQFGVVKNEYGDNIAPIKYESFIDFEPIKIKRSKK